MNRSLLRPLPLSIAPPAARLCDSVPPLLRQSIPTAVMPTFYLCVLLYGAY